MNVFKKKIELNSNQLKQTKKRVLTKKLRAMKKQDFIFNPLLIIIFSSLVLFGSCKKKARIKNEVNTTPVVAKGNMDATTLAQIHQDVIEMFELSKELYEKGQINADTTFAEQMYLSNVEYVNQYGLESLFQFHNIDVRLLDVFEYFIENEHSPDIYSSLAQNYIFSNLDEVRLLFIMAESYKIIFNKFNVNNPLNGYYSKIDIDCLGAIAITLGITIMTGATAMSGGIALVWFLVSKGWSYYNIYNACS